MIGSDRVIKDIESRVMGHHWTVKSIMNLEVELREILIKSFSEMSMGSIVDFCGEEVQKIIKEEFMDRAIIHASKMVSSYLDDAVVDLKSSAKLEWIENDSDNTDRVDNETVESDSMESEDEPSEDEKVPTQIKEMIRGDFKQLSSDDLKSRGMID